MDYRSRLIGASDVKPTSTVVALGIGTTFNLRRYPSARTRPANGRVFLWAQNGHTSACQNLANIVLHLADSSFWKNRFAVDGQIFLTNYFVLIHTVFPQFQQLTNRAGQPSLEHGLVLHHPIGFFGLQISCAQHPALHFLKTLHDRGHAVQNRCQ